MYGPNQDRIKHSDSNGRETKYIGGIYEEVTKGGITQKLHYIGDFAIFIQKGGIIPTNSYEYLHRDHIGSIVATSNGAANSNSDIQWQTNGAWGERRFEQWNGPLDSSLIPTSTAKGFTDHEHLDAVGLIHMNGRVYDPELGRFLSADPYVQAPYNSQSYNRYAYVFNNPLSYTDPTGYQAKEPETEETTTTGDRDRINNRCPNGAVCDNGEGPYNFLVTIMGGEREQWVYLNGTGYNFADLRGILAYSLAAGMKQSGQSTKTKAPDFILGAPSYAQGSWNLTQEQREQQAMLVLTGLSMYVGVGEVALVARAAWVWRAERAANGLSGLSKLHARVMLSSAQLAKKGSTVAGHALSKHAGRNPHIWGNVTGSMKTWNSQAMKHIREIMRGKGDFKEVTSDNIKFLEKRLDDGRGIRLNMDYTFKTFID